MSEDEKLYLECSDACRMAPKGGPCHCKCGGKYHGMDSTEVYEPVRRVSPDHPEYRTPDIETPPEYVVKYPSADKAFSNFEEEILKRKGLSKEQISKKKKDARWESSLNTFKERWELIHGKSWLSGTKIMEKKDFFDRRGRYPPTRRITKEDIEAEEKKLLLKLKEDYIRYVIPPKSKSKGYKKIE
jgi:hypothetical protein